MIPVTETRLNYLHLMNAIYEHKLSYEQFINNLELDV